MDLPQDEEYASCEWIEGGIAFNRRSLHACLIVHHDAGLPFIAPYNGGEIPVQQLLSEREHIRAANREGGHPACLGCPYLQKRRWPKPQYLIDLVGIAQYAHCNIACNYCFLQRQDRASFVDGFTPYPLRPVFDELIASGKLAPHAIVDWGGGEPTAYREFDELLELLLDHGTFHYIHTNGTILPSAIRHTTAPERIHVICSVDAGLPETYRQIKERDLLDRVWTNLAEYVRLGVRTTVKYIMLPENCDDANIGAFVDRATASGVSSLILDVDYNQPSCGPEIVAGLARLKHRALRAGMNVRFGFTGDRFAPELKVGDRLDEAFRQEQLAGIRALVERRGYTPRDCLDESVETLLEIAEAHGATTDAALQGLDVEYRALRATALQREAELVEKETAIAEKEAALQRLHADLDLARADVRTQRAEIRRLNADLRDLRSLGGVARRVARHVAAILVG